MFPLNFSDNSPLDEFEYWDNHPKYSVEDWKYSVENDETRLGYWEWVKDCISHDEEAETE